MEGEEMKIQIHNHRNGLSIIDEKMFNITLCSVEQQPVYEMCKNTVSEIKNAILDELLSNGWEKDHRLDSVSHISITASQNKIGLCLQTGNISRIYADLLKLQLLFTQGQLFAGIIILPTKSAAKSLGDNMVNFERVVQELNIFSQIITIPLVLIGFDKEE